MTEFHKFEGTGRTCERCSQPLGASVHDSRGKEFDYLALMADKDTAYEERSRLVALLARIFPSGLRKTNIEGWDEEWQNCVYIDLPTGQASWHFHDSHKFLFEGLPPYEKPYDGHTTEEKYGRVYAAMRLIVAIDVRNLR